MNKLMNTGPIMVLALLFVLAGIQVVQANEDERPGIEPRERYLLLDQRLISTVANAALKQGIVKKHPANPVFRDELPWEVNGSHMFPSVVFDPEENIYKCWYYSWYNGTDEQKAIKDDLKPGPEAPEHVSESSITELAFLYATSKDGINWEKPRFKQYLHKGEPTNIVFFAGDGVGVYRDPYDPDPSRRYKAIGALQGAKRIFTSCSSDGIHWSKEHDTKVNVSADGHNNVFWDPIAKQYVGISRVFSYGVCGYDIDNYKSIPWLSGFVVGQRVVARSTSKDFVEWSPPEIVFEYGHTRRQIYSMPSFYTHGVFLGLPMIYDTSQSYAKVLKEEKLNTPDLKAELKDAGKSCRIWPGLAWSPDSKDWNWVDQRDKALIPLSRDTDSDEWGMIFAAYAPVILDDEIRLYYSAQKLKHGNLHRGWMGLATLRVDGWAGYEPKDDSKEGFVETQPILCDGQTLLLAADYDTRFIDSAVTVTVKDTEGKVLGTGKLRNGSKPYASVEWKNEFNLSDHKGKNIRLRFTINHAKLYSFKFNK